MPALEKVFTKEAPKPLPQFSQAVKLDNMVYCSGNIGLDPTSWKLVEGGIKEQTTQALKNISAILESSGSSLDKIVKMNIFLTKMANFAAMNEAYDVLVKNEIKPCRTCVAVFELPFNALVEIECTAMVEHRA